MERVDEDIEYECPLLGKQVVIKGATRKELNGRAGVATDFDHAKKLYILALDVAEGEEPQKVTLKPLEIFPRNELHPSEYATEEEPPPSPFQGI